MRQEINFCTNEFLPKILWFSHAHGLFLLSIFLVGLFAYTSFQKKALHDIRFSNKNLSAAYMNLEDKSLDNTIVEKILLRKEEIANQIDRLSKEISNKNLIKQVYDKSESQKNISFYDIFYEIAKHKDNNISIATVSVYQGGGEVLIGGVGRYQNKIAEYIRLLRTEPVFYSVKFGLLSIKEMQNSEFFEFSMLREERFSYEN